MKLVKLGRSDFNVCRIGIGCGNGLSGDDLEYAVSLGINYIFQSSDLHAVTYSRTWPTIRRLWGGDSSRRGEIVFVACTYICDPEKVAAVLADQLVSWRMDHVDVFQWGWVTASAPVDRLLDRARGLVDDDDVGTVRKFVDNMLRVNSEVEHDLRNRGYARSVGVSTHDRKLAATISADPRLDVLMLRYNVAHRGAEDDVFPHLKSSRPGIVVFNVAHDGVKRIISRGAGGSAPGVLTFQNLYRWALSNPSVDVVLTGPRSRDEVERGNASAGGRAVVGRRN